MEKKETVNRKWYVIDAENLPLGRVATKAANLLRGKHKVTFTPHVDCGDYVIIINADKVKLYSVFGGIPYYAAAADMRWALWNGNMWKISTVRPSICPPLRSTPRRSAACPTS